MKKIIIVDGNNLMWKLAFLTTNKIKKTTELAYIFFNDIIKFKKFVNADNFVIAFDDINDSWRKDEYPDYKSNRRKKSLEIKDFVHQTINEIIDNFSNVFNIFQYKKMEADDIAYNFVKLYYNDYNIILYSSDADWTQLLKYSNVEQYTTVKKEKQYYDKEIILKKAIIGDSDNIKGIKGIGKKRYPKIKKLIYEKDKSVMKYIPIIKQNIKLIDLSKNPYNEEIENYIKQNFNYDKYSEKKLFNICKKYDFNIYLLLKDKI